MALISCSECGNMVSSMAAACPRCGCPVNKMTLKSRFYFDLDKDIDEGCFPIILKVGSKEFRINSFWAGQGCICVAEVFSNEVQTDETMGADVSILYTLQNLSFGSTEQATKKLNNAILGQNYLFKCEPFQKESRYSDGTVDFFIGIDITAISVNDESYNNLPLADLSQEKKVETAPDVFSIEDGVLKKYNGKDSNVSIPSTVTKIGDKAFLYRDFLTSITIPETVTEIGVEAFRDCRNLTSITIPDSVTSIGERAFEDCTSLEIVTFGNNVETIGYQAFADCSNLTSITIPETVTEIQESAFYRCAKLTSISLPDGITSIDEAVFGYCTSLDAITIPDSVDYIGLGAFCDCVSLSSVILSNSVETIEEEAFQNCSSLDFITIPDSVTSIGKESFKGCNNLTIHASAGSYAEQYAKENRFPFQTI